MALGKINGFTKRVGDLPDVPQMSSAELKNYFDSSPDEIKTAFNALVDALSSKTAGSSGASQIGVETVSGLSGTDIQAVLKGMKVVVDKKTVNDGDHAGTWQGYTPQNIPLAVTREQMFIIAEADTIYNGQSGERYPLGLSLMTISGSQWAYPENYGMVMTYKFSNVRMTQYFHQVAGGLNAYFRHWTIDNGYTAWQKLATDNTVNAAIGAVVKGGKIQAGTISFSLAASGNTSKTISFPEAFSTGPAVTASVRNSSNPENFGDLTITSVSSTGFTLVGRNNTISPVTVNYSWIAMV
ncbi:tail fiber protein [Bacillus phage Pookie]|uniref:Tail fiber protein n=1 Tax=Bacillus phage Pookie TaxID=1540093 RepID=A0A0A0RT17_9CAUD|nr:tail fiber protein [Bacillus phage Pookie]AIW03701.1 tail fiber protein [Bacillus phage Pookie]